MQTDQHPQPGDWVLLVSERDNRSYLKALKPGGRLATHRGYIEHDLLLTLPYGSKVLTHMGNRFYLLPPTVEDLARNIPRRTQIIFPKDSGYIIMKLGVRPGVRVAEAGSGSGALTMVLATYVAETGHIYSYDLRPDLQELAVKNLHAFGLGNRVSFYERDVAEGFIEQDLDALFLDLPRPWDYLPQVRSALRGGAMFGAIVPTVNQLVELVEALRRFPGFGFVEITEIIQRPYKVVPARIRPEDHQITHTGYLVFARAVIAAERTDEADLSDLDSDADGSQVHEPE